MNFRTKSQSNVGGSQRLKLFYQTIGSSENILFTSPFVNVTRIGGQVDGKIIREVLSSCSYVK